MRGSLIFWCIGLVATLAHAAEDPNIAVVLDVPPPPSSALGEVISVEAEPSIPETPDLPRANVTASEVPQHGMWMGLDGALSNDPLRGELQYQWKQTGGPRLPFLPEELTRPQAWVYLAFPGQYRFALKVKNAKGWSPAREVILEARENTGTLTLEEARKLAGAGKISLFRATVGSRSRGPEFHCAARTRASISASGWRAFMFSKDRVRAGARCAVALLCQREPMARSGIAGRSRGCRRT